MSVGDGGSAALRSYVSFGRESTFGTYASATSAMEALSCTFKTDIKSMKLDQMFVQRGYARRVQLDKEVKGTLEHYLHPQESVLPLVCAFGGQLSTTSLTAASTHSISAGNFAGTIASLSFNVRKGDTHTWRYSGGRVNSLKITGSVGEPIKASYDFLFADSTQQADDISAALSISTVLPFTYVGGNFKYSSSEGAAANSNASERIQAFELQVNNNLKYDKDVRQLGTNTATLMPALKREITFKITQRFDTTTTWARFVQATEGAVELFFRGQAISAEYFYDMTIRLPRVLQNTPDPEISGPDSMVMSEIDYDVLVDNPSTTTGKDIGLTIINAQAYT